MVHFLVSALFPHSASLCVVSKLTGYDRIPKKCAAMCQYAPCKPPAMAKDEFHISSNLVRYCSIRVCRGLSSCRAWGGASLGLSGRSQTLVAGLQRIFWSTAVSFSLLDAPRRHCPGVAGSRRIWVGVPALGQHGCPAPSWGLPYCWSYCPAWSAAFRCFSPVSCLFYWAVLSRRHDSSTPIACLTSSRSASRS
jgi:hypothetical protein